MTNDQLLLLQGAEIPSLPDGSTPIDSITGAPSQKTEEKGILVSIWDTYTGFWGKAGDIVTGDQDSFYGKETASDDIQTNQQSAYSPSLLVIFLAGAALIYALRKVG